MIDGYKVIESKEMARIEALSFQEGASAEKYMSKAATNIAAGIEIFCAENGLKNEVTLLAGKGNNAGDGFLALSILLKKGFLVTAYHFFSQDESSTLCKEKLEEYKALGGNIIYPKKEGDLMLSFGGVILDGIFGTGFTGAVNPFIGAFIQKVNHANLPIISIDIPSGLNGSTGAIEGPCIKATKTFYLGLPKIGFFLENAVNFIGDLKHIDFGLDIKYIHEAKAKAHLFNEKGVHDLLPPIGRSRHKYDAGYVLGIAGSKGMSGAAFMSSFTALRSGSGIVRVFHPKDMEVDNAPLEVILQEFNEFSESEIEKELKRAKSIYIGPGLIDNKQTKSLVLSLLSSINIPLVIDAGGFDIVKDHLKKLPERTILTPHKGEMEKLLSTKLIDPLVQCQEFVEEYGVTLVLKGCGATIFSKGKMHLIVFGGDPGMATAGTGDVLTGVIASLLSQGLECRDAAAFGVFIHALSGEIAAIEMGSYSLVASDLIEMLPEVFKAYLF